jgi:hypothetical protein
VVLGAANWAQLGLDQLQKLRMHDGQRTHTDLMPMTAAYHCQAKEGNQARRMAWYASWGTNAFRRIIMRQGKLHQVAMNHTISAESPPTAYVGQLSNEELVAVVVTVPFFWQPQWTIRDPAPKLEKFDFSLSVRAAKIQPPRIKGRPANSVPLDPPVKIQTGLVTED